MSIFANYFATLKNRFQKLMNTDVVMPEDENNTTEMVLILCQNFSVRKIGILAATTQRNNPVNQEGTQLASLTKILLSIGLEG